MGQFIKGDVVVIPFPFSNFSSSKRRPALVIAQTSDNELILAQITSRSFQDKYALELSHDDFAVGKLHVLSYIRTNKLFTVEDSLILYKAGHLEQKKVSEVVDSVVVIIKS